MTPPEVIGSTQDEDGARRFRARLAAACLVLLGLAMIQSPGLLVPDTKLDLAIAPLDFLQRAAHLWDAEGAFGQLQNQAYGYLWPMGPFFVLGWLVDLPGWVVQRLWLALVLCVAFVGSAKLSRELGVRSDLATIVAAFAFALSPRMLTTLGPISIEAWPSALAPWVLLPLVTGSRRGSPWRAAALSAVAVAMVGGVNAAATAAVLPLGVLWLLTRTPGRRRRAMMLWWPVFTLLGTLWWLVPLFVMGAYSPPFLDYIESAANTTFPTTLFDALRGTSNWVPYVDSSSRAGNDLIRDFYLVLNSGVVLVAGLVGLMLRRNPHRLFLTSGVIVGLLLVTMGHTGATQGWFAPQVQGLLDGPLAPLRNVHKFDPVVRLPLVIGLAWVLQELADRARAAEPLAERVNLRVLAGILTFAVAATAIPAMTGRITPAGGFQSVPDYWQEATSWLAEEQDEGVALLVPGSSFGQYAWGTPRDEPMQFLADKPWAVRNAVPLTPPGNIRMLDAVEQRLAEGRGSPGLGAFLRRSGVSHLVVRNDLERRNDIVDPVLVHEAVETSPGLRLVASFGPEVGGEAHLEQEGRRVLVNGGWQNQYPAIEVFAVDPKPTYAVAVDEPVTVVGGPEDLLSLADLGILGEAPSVLASDLEDGAAAGGPVVLTDGNRAVERHFGRLHDNVSETLVQGQDLRLRATVRDYLLPDPERWSTFAEHRGISAVTASSSKSDPSAAGESEGGAMPFSAVDGQVGTAWKSGRFAQDVHWWRVDFLDAEAVGRVEITAGPDEDQEVVLRTPTWTSDPVRLEAGESAEIVAPERDVDWLMVEDASGRAGTRMSLAEVSIPGVDPIRSLVLPELPGGHAAPDVIALRAVDDFRTGCAVVDGAVRCVPERAMTGEEPLGFSRTLTLPTAATYPVSMEARPLAGPALDALILDDRLVGVTASSVGNPDPRASATAAVDGDPGTTWTADQEDLTPTLSLSWLGRRTVRGLDLTVADDTAARLPSTLNLRWPGGRRVVEVDQDGEADFEPIRTKQLSIGVQEAETVTSLGFDGSGFDVPIGVSELQVRGLPFLPVVPSTKDRDLPCGSGPEIEVNGVGWQTSISASPADLAAGRAVPAALCRASAVPLAQGENRIRVGASFVFAPESLLLGDLRGPSVATGSTTRLDGPVRRELEINGSVVGTRENANPGWEASRGGTPQVVDGWRQGWSAGPTPDDTMTATFRPDGAYRAGMGLGLVSLLVLVLVLVGLVLVRRRHRNDLPPLGEVAPRSFLVLPGAVVAAGLLTGTVGAVLAGLVIGVVLVVRRMAGPFALAVPAALLVPSVGASVVRTWGDASGWAGDLAWPGYLVAAGSCGALAFVAVDSVRRHRLLTRRAGSSTTR